MNKDHYALKDMLNQRAKRKRENQNMCKMEKENHFRLLAGAVPSCSLRDVGATVKNYDRKTYVGGGDAAAILGVSPWKTPIQCYRLKVGEDVEDETDVCQAEGIPPRQAPRARGDRHAGRGNRREGDQAQPTRSTEPLHRP